MKPRTKPPYRLFRRHRVTALLGVLALMVAGVVVPAAPAQAAVACDVSYRATYWNQGAGGGGFQANITITNLGDPIDGWTLGFTLPAGQSFRSGWGATWQGTTGPLTASSYAWNGRLGTGQHTAVGFIGTWSGARTDPTSFTLNGVPCVGAAPPANQPPTVTLTSPTPGTIVTRPGTLRMAATAADPDGAVTVVQFFVNETLVGTDDSAPYEVNVSTGLFGFGATAAWARAFDNGSPPLTADTAQVPFQVVTVPPLSIVAEPTALSVTEGGTGFFDLRLTAAGANAIVALTVTGAPGVTVSPTSVVFGPQNTTQRITVTAAPGSGGSVATVTAAADPSQQIGTAKVTVTVLDGPTEPVSNPYQGAAVYVDPDWAAQAQAQAAATAGDLGRRMAGVATHPTAVWLDAIDAITSGRGLVGHLDAALAQQQASGAGAMVVQLVLYDIPGRDCMQRAAPGELTATESDQQRYRTQFIDPIVEIVSRPRYAGLRVVTLVEPHALPSLVLAQPSRPFPDCTGLGPAYRAAVRYALSRLGGLDNTYNYLDFSFSGFLGYPDNFQPTAGLLADVVLGSGGPGAASVTGFVTNIGQYAPLAEPFITDPELLVGGSPVYTSRFFDWNREIAELGFAQRTRAALIQRGFPANVGMLIDTSRNGWGGPDRPTAQSTSPDLNTFVDQSRIDRRPTRISWCNQVGAGIGARPQAAPVPGVHAYAWITPPGISDGVAEATAPADPDRPFLRHRDRCNPRFQEPQGALIPSNALAGAPHAGRWFPEFFAQLVRNAHPPVAAS
jgi:cellulose 1,4-beta-cellobiosidase